MGKDEGSRRNFRPVRGFQDAVVSQQYFAAREPVSIACGAQIGIRHRHGSRAEVNSSAGAHGFRLADQSAGLFVFVNGRGVDGACGDEGGISQGNISMGDNLAADSVIHG